jgi:protein O-GlcNAc transferase
MTNWLRRLISGTPPRTTETQVVPADSASTKQANTSQAELYQSAAREALRINDFASAAKQFLLLVEARPGDIGAWTSLGYAQRQSGQIEAAMASLRQAASLDQTRGEPHYMLSEMLRDQHQTGAAIEQLQLAISAGPEFWFAYPDLVELLLESGQRQRAAAVCEQGMAALPQSARLLLLRANLATLEHDDETALANYRGALELVPGNLDARLGVGLALQRLGRFEEGLAEFERCIAEAPEHAASRWAWVMGHLPACVGPLAASPLNQQPFLDALSLFSEWAASHRFDQSTILGKYLPFLLAYREENHQPMLSRYGATCAELAHGWQSTLAIAARPTGTSSEKPDSRLRIGLASPFFSHHSVWHAILKGWIKAIDRTHFELIAFHLSSVSDEETSWARQHVDRFEEAAGDAASWARRIAASSCDALIYGSIGMDELSSQLANLRLAPVQAVTWGHPETSGLASIDYFISGQQFEPLDAQQAYSERLVQLPHLGVNYPAGTIGRFNFDVTTLGLDADLPILICPGTPFKYSPLHDAVLVEIARHVAHGQLVFFQSGFTSMALAFRKRIEQAFVEAGLQASRCHFVPWMNLNDFHGLLQAADVFVDTIGFSGFNTAIQAIECGLPIATLEGQFMRGRLASGVLHRMGMSDLVVADGAALVALVTRLAHDQAFNGATRERIVAQRAVLFDDETPVRALEEFLMHAVAEQRRLIATS